MPIPALVAGAATMASPLIYGYGRHILGNDSPAPVVQNNISNLSQLSDIAARNNADLNAAVANAAAQTTDPVSAFLAGYSRTDPVFLNNGTSTDIGTLNTPTRTVTPKTARQATRTASKSSATPATTSGSNSQNQRTSTDISRNAGVDTNGFGWLNDLLPLLAAGGLGYLLAK